ncbi:MAG TPA: CARDB domain-containing protein [Candidatus Paceibacterota bacterium]
MTGSCSVSPTSITTGGSATWGASASGGNGSYTYSWNGTDSLSGSASSVSKSYATVGTKTGSVTITSGSQSTTVNCSNSLTVTTPPPAPITGSCSVSPTSITAGGSATWSSSVSGGTGSYAYAWTGTDSLTGSASSVTKSYSATGTKTASVTVTSGSQSAVINCSNNLDVGVAPQADLTAGAVTTATSVTLGTAVNFSAPATNEGNATSGSFPILFDVENTGVVNSGYLSALAPGASAWGGANYTYGAVGTYRVRACANYNTSWTAITPESNYGNNCGGWTTVTVTAAPVTPPPSTPDLSCAVSSTNVSVGQSVTYTPGGAGSGATYNFTSPDNYSATGSSATRTFSSAGEYAMSVSKSGYTTKACAVVTVGGGTPASCTNPVVDISASPTRVPKGASANVTWNASCVASSCSISGPSVSGSLAPSATPQNGSATPTINAQSVYTISCDGNTARDQVIVNIIPQFTEF